MCLHTSTWVDARARHDTFLGCLLEAVRISARVPNSGESSHETLPVRLDSNGSHVLKTFTDHSTELDLGQDTVPMAINQSWHESFLAFAIQDQI